jgi:protein phosphatase 1L
MISKLAGKNGELSVSRSFGDKEYINFGLIAEPEITKVELESDSMFLILATDGFWNVFYVIYRLVHNDD